MQIGVLQRTSTRYIPTTLLAVSILLVPAAVSQQAAPSQSQAVAPESLPSAPMPSDAALAQVVTPRTLLPVATESARSSSLEGTAAQPSQQSPASSQQQAPASPTPSLSDLVLSPAQTKPDPDLQARLDRHTSMLKVHQRVGLLMLAPLAAACISSA